MNETNPSNQTPKGAPGMRFIPAKPTAPFPFKLPPEVEEAIKDMETTPTVHFITGTAGACLCGVYGSKSFVCGDSLERETVQLKARVSELESQNVTFRNAQKACEDCDGATVAEVINLRARVSELERELEALRSAGPTVEPQIVQENLALRAQVEAEKRHFALSREVAKGVWATHEQQFAGQEKRIAALESALFPFTFPSSPDGFMGTDGECDDALIDHASVQKARAAIDGAK